MSDIQRFEDLIAWQKARALVRSIYRVTDGGRFARDLRLTGEIRAASVSVMSNVAEGFERSGRAEFHQFLTIAKASCAETRSLLYVSLDAGYIDRATFGLLSDQAEEVARVVPGLRAAVGRQRAEQRAPRSTTPR